ncbi:MAG: serine hydrolase [Thermoclostridium sp.]|nr:serine hydrolase [Thermoclostridium sp.]
MGDYYPGEDWIKVKPEDVGVNAMAVNHASEQLPLNNTVIGMMVVKDGYIVFEQYNPRFGPNTISQVFSVTKSVISALLGIALAQKRIESVDDTVYRYFPEAEPHVSDYLKKTVTIRHLATMTSGLYASRRNSFGSRIEETDNWLKNILELPVSLKIANTFHYNDLYPHLISALIARQTGMSTLEYANTQLFDRIGMRQAVPLHGEDVMANITGNKVLPEDDKNQKSHWICDPQGLAAGGFGLMTDLRDMARFGYLYLKGGRWKDEQVICEQWVKESTQIYTDTGNREPLSAILGEKDQSSITAQSGWISGYGYYWWVYEGELRYYCALGYGGQRILVIPSKNMVVAIKTTYSGMSAYQHAEDLWKKIVRESEI